jgi:Protein of unknown function (DUF3563)
MNPVWNLLRQLAERNERDRQARQHAYLAQSADIGELERRMRELDRAQQVQPHWMGGTGA